MATDYCRDLLFPCRLQGSWTASTWTCWLERTYRGEAALLFQPRKRRWRRIEESSVRCLQHCWFHRNKYRCQETALVQRAIVQYNVQRPGKEISFSLGLISICFQHFGFTQSLKEHRDPNAYLLFNCIDKCQYRKLYNHITADEIFTWCIFQGAFTWVINNIWINNLKKIGFFL